MNLHDAIAGLNDAFFDTDGFAEEVIYLPEGNSSWQFPVNAIVDWEAEEGNGQIRGQGRAGLNQQRGRSTMSQITVEMPTTRIVNEQPVPMRVSESGKDRVIVNLPGSKRTARFAVRRIIGRDEAAISVLCTREKQHETQSVKSRFG